MGIIELSNDLAFLKANIFLYGNAASDELAQLICRQINDQWSSANASILVKGNSFTLLVLTTGFYAANLTASNVIENVDPLNNYFRVEIKAGGGISYVDGLGSNTGYFKLDNLLNNSTTAAHEFGHTLGLPHPHDLDIRHKEYCGIMYPRGTLVQPRYQYDPLADAGAVGGTINPVHRVVTQEDVDDLKIERLNFNKNGQAVMGDFTNIWHEAE